MTWTRVVPAIVEIGGLGITVVIVDEDSQGIISFTYFGLSIYLQLHITIFYPQIK